jgi:hypothetical protein
MEGDWVLVYDSSLDKQHSTTRKLSRRWFGLYIVTKVEDNATYRLSELDGTPLALPIARKRVKIFWRRESPEVEFDALQDSSRVEDDEGVG